MFLFLQCISGLVGKETNMSFSCLSGESICQLGCCLLFFSMYLTLTRDEAPVSVFFWCSFCHNFLEALSATMSPHKIVSKETTSPNGKKFQLQTEKPTPTRVNVTNILSVEDPENFLTDEEANIGAEMLNGKPENSTNIGLMDSDEEVEFGEGDGEHEEDDDDDGFCIVDPPKGESQDTVKGEANQFLSLPQMRTKVTSSPLIENEMFAIESSPIVANQAFATIIGLCGGFDQDGNPQPSFANWLLEQTVNSGTESFFAGKNIGRENIFYAVDKNDEMITKEYKRKDGSTSSGRVALIVMYTKNELKKDHLLSMLANLYTICQNLQFNNRPIRTKISNPTSDSVLSNSAGLGRYMSSEDLVQLMKRFYPDFSSHSDFLSQNKLVCSVVERFYAKGTWDYDRACKFGVPLNWMTEEARLHHLSNKGN